MPLKPKPDITIIVTALNEEKNVAHFLKNLQLTLQGHKISHEVVFVDDGSTDKTYHEVLAFSDWIGLKHIRLEKNRGSGGAIKEGLKIANGEWYAWLPCDLEIMPSELILPLSKRARFDAVITYFNIGKQSRSLKRRVLSNLFTKILNLMFGQRLPYYNGLSIIRRKLIDADSIQSNGFFFHAELLIRCLAKTQNVTFVPIRQTARQEEKTKAIRFKVFLDVVICFIKTWWDLRFDKKSLA
jgi:dolichol-phosphate mannosyltransferase